MKPSLEDLALWRKNKLDKMHLKNEGEDISLSYLMIFFLNRFNDIFNG